MHTWTAIRHKLEQDYLAEALRGHIRYFASTYRESHDREGRAAILLDGEEILAGSYFQMGWKEHLFYEKVNAEAAERGAFDQRSFYQAFYLFDRQSIGESLQSENVLVRIFALLDRRTGKRRLLAMRVQMEQEPEVLRRFYRLRMQAEHLCE